MYNQNLERIETILKQAKTFFFATVDGDQARVRPFGAVQEIDDKLYFCTNNHKKVYENMQANPKVEICAMISDERWIRVSGKAEFVYDVEIKKAMLDANPELRKMYNEEDKIFEIFYLSNLAATIYSMIDEPEVIC